MCSLTRVSPPVIYGFVAMASCTKSVFACVVIASISRWPRFRLSGHNGVAATGGLGAGVGMASRRALQFGVAFLVSPFVYLFIFMFIFVRLSGFYLRVFFMRVWFGIHFFFFSVHVWTKPRSKDSEAERPAHVGGGRTPKPAVTRESNGKAQTSIAAATFSCAAYHNFFLSLSFSFSTHTARLAPADAAVEYKKSRKEWKRGVGEGER